MGIANDFMNSFLTAYPDARSGKLSMEELNRLMIRAFEKELWDAYQKGEKTKAMENYHHAYGVRFFECFTSWFGLINIECKREPGISYFDQLTITKSKLFDQLFVVKISN